MEDDTKTISGGLIVGGFILLLVAGAAVYFLFFNNSAANTTASTSLSSNSTTPTTSTTTTNTQDTSSNTSASGTTSGSNGTTTGSTGTNTSSYKDGTYQASGTYFAPSGYETIGVQLSVSNGVVQSVTVTPDSNDFESLRYQQRFISGVSSVVVGKKLDQAYIYGRINGASLTPEGFNSALDSIISQSKV